MSFFGGTVDDDATTTTTLRQTWDYLAPPPSHPGTEYLMRDTIIRWLDFTTNKPSRSSQRNSINLVNVRNFENSEVPLLTFFSRIEPVHAFGLKCRSHPIFSQGGPRFPKKEHTTMCLYNITERQHTKNGLKKIKY